MSGVEGVGGKDGIVPSEQTKRRGKSGAFQAVQAAKGGQGGAPAGKSGGGAGAGERSGAQRPASGGFQVSNPEPIKAAEGPAPTVRPEVAAFAQGMVQAADAAAMPGPTTESDLLPRESVSGLFVRDFALQGAVALGRAPLGEDEAARIVIEKHIAGTPGVYYDAAVEADGDDAYLVRLHRLDTNPPFLPAKDAEASYRIDRRTWAIEEHE
jgi:hypothetical protein